MLQAVNIQKRESVMRKKQIIKSISSGMLSTVMVLSSFSALTGCTQTPPVEENVEPTEETVAVSEDTVTPETEADNSGLPMDPSVMAPWVNSNIIGMADMSEIPSYKDDFYSATNYEWLNSAELRPGYSSESPMYDATDIVKERCLEILDDESITGADADLIKNHYELALDWEGRNEVGLTPIEPLIDAINAIETRDDLTEFLLSDLNYEYGYTFILPIGLTIYSADSNLYEVGIYTPNLLLGDAAEYTELTENGKRVKEYWDGAASYMLGRLGMSEDEIQDTLTNAYEFDAKLAGQQKTLLEKYDPSYLNESINMVTMEDLAEMSPDFPLVPYMEKYGWAESELIDVEWPNSVTGLNELYTEENVEGIKAKLLVTNVCVYISMLDEDAFRKQQELYNAYAGIDESESDEDIAYKETRGFYPDSFARIYVEKYLDANVKTDITNMCEECIATYSDMLDSEEWMTEETRAAAKEKLGKITIHAVYPDKWEDYSIFHVKSKAEGGTYFEALMSYYNAIDKQQRSRINGRVDKEIWGIDILTTNAFYNPTDNSINIIPGFFCDATYSEDMTVEQKYGAIGVVIGHEVSHAFDTNGAQYDADGNVFDWWTEEDKIAFDERAQKLVEFYDNVVAFDDGTPYQGQIVQTEAIADMAGIKCMLLMAEDVEDFNYDEFFKSYVYLWADIETIESAESAVLTDPHPLPYLRGNVTVQQFDEFYETYGIEEGDGMYLAPEDRIAVW